MNKIILAQPGFRQGPKKFNQYYLPYSVGCVWAYATEHDQIVQNFEMSKLIFRRENITDLIKQHHDTDYLLCSVYVWNEQWLMELSKAFKKHNPNIKIIWGGPQCDHHNPKFFVDRPYVDIVAVGEGEKTVTELLIAYINKTSLYNVQGLAINEGSSTHKTNPRPRSDLEDFPSPYSKGIFEPLIYDPANKDLGWASVLETNRGCPYKCTYCDWGSATASKVKKMIMDKVEQEIKWFSDHKILYIDIADANFGILKERDLHIAKKFVEVYKQTGYPEQVRLTMAKNANEHIVDIAKILEPINRHGMTLSIQSTNTKTLEHIKRSNMKINKWSELIELSKKKGLKNYTDLILPLPGETLQSWKNGMYEIYRGGLHESIMFLPLLVMPNTEMNLEQKQKYNMKTELVPLHYSKENTDPVEMAEEVYETETMPRSDLLEAHWFFYQQQATHMMGWSKFASQWAEDNNIGYETFYDIFLQKLNRYEWWHKEKIRKDSQLPGPKVFTNNKSDEKFYEDNHRWTGDLLLQTLTHRKEILNAVKETLDELGCMYSRDILEHTKRFVWNPLESHLWPSTYQNKKYQFDHDAPNTIQDYYIWLAYKIPKNYMSVTNLN